LPYPSDWPAIPLIRQRHECRYFIEGHPRRRIRLNPPTEIHNGTPTTSKSVKIETDEDDEEAAMNLGISTTKTKNQGDEEKPEYGLEPETSRHHPREPLVSVLQSFNSVSYP